MMDITRNQFFFAGLLCILLGGEFLLIDTVDLTPEFTLFLAERTGHPLAAVSNASQTLTQSDRPLVKRTIQPPPWIGSALVSIGAVLILHSWGMKKPG